MSELPERTEALVIGGGVIGTSIACHLAEAGVGTVLLERGTLGSGASGATANVVRTYFPNDARTGGLAARSMAAYHAFAERTGTPLGLQRVGFMVLFTEEEQVAKFRRDHAAQQAAGVDVELVSAAEAARLNPLLDERTILAAAWSPDAFSCDPTAIVRGYAAAAQEAGAVVCTESPVTGIDPDGRVHTPAGSILAENIICAAGPWSETVGDMAGVHLPMTPEPTELLLADPPAVPFTNLPMTLHPTRMRIRAWKDRILVGMGRPRQDESREAWLQRLARQLGTTYPALEGIRLRRGWTGSFDSSKDGTALIGRDPSRPFFYATGFSGTGLCQAPAAGELLRDLYLGK
ncbi:NAD(P)/FAD-dependent oxidoreductase [Streptomyces celluloflavus]|uniref:NAD(P)/FAD-dependent oxidoreductase n=1 Tax=Streptomyces celluloflavus TaxID=58344 RepID=A0ABW7RAS4_9ACTN